MARSRVYRHDVRCPDCGSNWMRRDGCSRNGHQIYKCGDCQRRHRPRALTVVPARQSKNGLWRRTPSAAI